MTDQELLELAADAMGWVKPLHYGKKSNSLIWASASGFPTAWAPLDDDKDAFDLMVTLGIAVFHGWTFADEKIPYANVYAEHAPSKISLAEIKNDDPKSATRRAIVRVAAELAKIKEIA